MAVLSVEELLQTVKERIGEDSSDETIKFVEDITDTLKDFEEKTKTDGEDWKKKFEENDKAWRERYTSRFFENEEKDEPNNNDVIDENKPKTFDDLFKTN